MAYFGTQVHIATEALHTLHSWWQIRPVLHYEGLFSSSAWIFSSFLHQECSWWLVSSQGHSQILSCSHGEPIFLEGSEIKSGSALGMRLATNYAPYEEVMKTLSHCLETSLHRKRTNTQEESWEVSGYCVKCVGKLTVRKSSCRTWNSSYTAMYIYNLQFDNHDYS